MSKLVARLAAGRMSGIDWGVSPLYRWGVAGLVTAAVFGAVTAACGLFLSLVVRDAVILWTVASALGVAMAGLAALWGKWWAGRERKHPETDHRDERANAEPGLRAGSA